MLTKEENELICRVGPGTPMGEVFRRYWILAAVSTDIAEPDSPPVRIRLLGEDLILFRDTNGNVGLLAEKCSHRRASLFYGRNEECGLRCIYHGWKYDVEGNILDTPAEPAESMIKHHVKHTAYPTFEKNGMIMTYMGPKEKQPLVPNYEWFTLPEDQVRVGDKYWNENNWLQAVEGDCDSSHFSYLHRNAGSNDTIGDSMDLAPGQGEHLNFELQQGDWWIKAAAIRPVAPDQKYVRINSFCLPCIGIPPTQPAINGITDGVQAVYQVPADDYHTWRVDIATRRSGPIPPRFDVQHGWPGLEGARPVRPDGKKTANRENDYLIDRDMQKTRVFAGIPFGAHTQDAAMTETMGAISDRENEHLGVGDAEPIAMRQMLLRTIRDVQSGKDVPGVAFRSEDNNFDVFGDTINVTLPLDASWTDLEQVQSRLIYSGGPPKIKG